MALMLLLAAAAGVGGFYTNVFVPHMEDLVQGPRDSRQTRVPTAPTGEDCHAYNRWPDLEPRRRGVNDNRHVPYEDEHPEHKRVNPEANLMALVSPEGYKESNRVYWEEPSHWAMDPFMVSGYRAPPPTVQLN